jgi:hypothetical protein
MPVTGQDYYFDDDAEDILIENDQLKRSSIMKIWLLKPVDHLPDRMSPWFPGGNTIHGFVVRASSEEKARSIADENAGWENSGKSWNSLARQNILGKSEHPWLDPELSICVELIADGKEEVILKDYWEE